MKREIPPGLDDLVRRCLARNPDQRWQSAVDVMRALHDVSERDRPGSSRPAPFLRATRRNGSPES